MSGRSARWVVAGLLAGCIGLLIGLPLFELLRVASEQGLSVLAEPELRGAIVNTLLVGSLTSLVAVSLGAGAALAFDRVELPGRRWLRLAILVPVLIPAFVSALSWHRAFGPGGLVDDVLGWELPGLMGLVGVVAVISLNAVPVTFLLTGASLATQRSADGELAARASGARPGTVLRTVTLPLLSPALVAGGALAFVMGTNSFGVPAVLGTPAGFSTVTTTIYQDLARSSRPESFSRAVLLAAVLVAIAFVVVVVGELALSRVGDGGRSGEAAGLGPRRTRAAPAVAGLMWLLVVVTSVVPLVALILTAITRGVGMDPVPANWTLANVGEAVSGGFLGGLVRSVLLSITAATLVVGLGAAVSALRGGRFGRLIGTVVLASFAIPGSTLAVAMLLGYGSVLRDTITIILLAYVAKLWAIGHRSIAGSVANVAPDLARSARMSGAGTWAVLRTVTVPLLRPAVLAGWSLAFLAAFHEIAMSSLLYGPGTDTLAVAVLNVQQLGDVPVSSALAVVLTLPPLLLVAPLLVFDRIPRRLMRAP